MLLFFFQVNELSSRLAILKQNNERMKRGIEELRKVVDHIVNQNETVVSEVSKNGSKLNQSLIFQNKLKARKREFNQRSRFQGVGNQV